MPVHTPTRPLVPTTGHAPDAARSMIVRVLRHFEYLLRRARERVNPFTEIDVRDATMATVARVKNPAMVLSDDDVERIVREDREKGLI